MNTPEDSAQALFLAIASDEPDAVFRALDAGADPNYANPDDGRTPLYLACSSSLNSALAALLDRGADPTQPFTFTSCVDHRVEADAYPILYVRTPRALELLLEAGADINAKDADGRTALTRAAFRGDREMVGALLGAGADPAMRQRGHRRHSTMSARELAEYKLAFFTEESLNFPSEVSGRVSAYRAVIEILDTVASKPTG